MKNRVEWTHDGLLDEIVTDGGAHLERTGKDRWFLECHRKDGTSIAVWIDGKVLLVEERDAPTVAEIARERRR